MFNVYLVNFPDRGLVGSFESLEAAKAAGMKAGFEFAVMKDGNLVGAWGVFSGWRVYQ